MQDEILSVEEINQLADRMNKKNAAFIEDRHFKIEVAGGETEVAVTVILENKDQSFHYPLEMRLSPKKEEILPRKAALFLIDYADLYFEDYLESKGELLIPIEWSDFEYDTVLFQIKGQIRNLKLEKMADEFLSSHGEHLPV